MGESATVRETESGDAGRVVLVGTNHISDESGVHVRSAIRRHDPDVVAVELGPTRANELAGDGRSHREAISDLYTSGGVRAVGAYLALAAVYEQYERPADGGDMAVGARTAAASDTPIALIDRDTIQTLPSVADGLLSDWSRNVGIVVDALRDIVRGLRDRDGRAALSPLWEFARFVASWYWIAAKVQFKVSPDTPVERLPPSLLQETLIDYMDGVYPELTQALLHDRDDHLAGRLHALRESGQSVVAVVGALHVPGVRDRLENPAQIPTEMIDQPATRDAAEFEELI